MRFFKKKIRNKNKTGQPALSELPRSTFHSSLFTFHFLRIYQLHKSCSALNIRSFILTPSITMSVPVR